MIGAILANSILSDISRAFLNQMIKGKPIERASEGVKDGGVRIRLRKRNQKSGK